MTPASAATVSWFFRKRSQNLGQAGLATVQNAILVGNPGCFAGAVQHVRYSLSITLAWHAT